MICRHESTLRDVKPTISYPLVYEEDTCMAKRHVGSEISARCRISFSQIYFVSPTVCEQGWIALACILTNGMRLAGREPAWRGMGGLGSASGFYSGQRKSSCWIFRISIIPYHE